MNQTKIIFINLRIRKTKVRTKFYREERKHSRVVQGILKIKRTKICKGRPFIMDLRTKVEVNLRNKSEYKKRIVRRHYNLLNRDLFFKVKR